MYTRQIHVGGNCMVMIVNCLVGNGRQKWKHVQYSTSPCSLYLAKMVSSWRCELLRPGCWSMERSRLHFQVTYSFVNRTPVSLIRPFRVVSSNSCSLTDDHALSLSLSLSLAYRWHMLFHILIGSALAYSWEVPRLFQNELEVEAWWLHILFLHLVHTI